MDFLDFLTKYTVTASSKLPPMTEFREDWKKLSEANNYNRYAAFVMEQMIENRFPSILIKELFNLNSNNKEILNNPDIFKWSAAFHFGPLIEFFYKNLNIKDEDGAINAAIINGRLDNLKTLEKLGLNVFSEKHFCQVMNRDISIGRSNIFEYYIDNIDKVEITEYANKILQKHDYLIDRCPEVENLFKIKILNNKLTKELPTEETKKSSKMKV